MNAIVTNLAEIEDAASVFPDLVDISEKVLARRTPEEALQLVRNEVLASEESHDSALFDFMCGAVADDEGIDTFERVYTCRGGKNAFRINGYGSIHEGKTLALAVSSFEDVAHISPLGVPEQKSLINLAANYLAIIRDGRYKDFPEGGGDREIAEKVRQMFDKCDSVRFIVMTDRHVLRSAGSSGRKHQFEKKLTFSFWGPMQYADAVSPDGTGQDVDYVLSNILPDDGVLPFSEVPTSDKKITTYLVALPGYVLADIYGTYGQKAYEANVRSFLGGGKGVNKEIAQTLEREPGMFHIYNNGITLRATAVTKEMRNGVLGLNSMKGLQIVNGGQTTATMFFASAKAKAESVVMCKIVVGESESKPDLTKEVSKSSNSQNSVKKADLTANDIGNIEFERLSRSISIRGRQWYYERIRCQFDNEKRLRAGDKVDLDRFLRRFDTGRKITKTDVASVLSLWEGFPHYVTSGAESNFTRWHRRTGGLPGNVNEALFRKVVASIIIWREASLLVKSMFKDYRQAIVNYTIALIAMKANSQEFFDAVWQAQGISPEFAGVIRELAEVVNSELRDIAGDRAPSATSRMISTWKELSTRLADREIVMPEMNIA
ncbi:AIPR family protein [Agrobacterium salinitolerans]|nr:AIPR family protein [Agrobacterium salinitolerans]